MALTRIILWLGNSLILVALLLAVTAVGALFVGEVGEAAVFGVMTVIMNLIGAMFVATMRGTPARETNTDALAFLLLFWIAIPIVLAIPYWVLGAVSSPYTAYFEAVSAITTTGASSLDPDNISRSLHIWRSSLQWIGGVTVATFAVVILAALNLRGTGVHRSMLFTLKKGELFERLTGIGGVVASIYALISFLCFCSLIISGTSVFDAFCLALTAVSTGGLTPQSGVLATYINPFGVMSLTLACLLGGANVAVIWDFFRLRTWRSAVAITQNVEHRAMGAVFLVLLVFGFFYAGMSHGFTVFVEAIFFVTSAGYDYHVIGLDMVPPVILISAALIGGSALSTAGGLKLIRMILLFRHLGTDLRRLTHPSRIVSVRFRGQILPDSAFLSIWMYFFGYTIVFALGTLGLAAVGLEYDMAVATSAASLANMGPLLDATLPSFTYSDFTIPQQLISAALMLLGRVEVLAAFAIMSPGLWRR